MLGRHPPALLRSLLSKMGCVDTRELGSLRREKRVRHAGMTITRQRPGEAGGVSSLLANYADADDLGAA
jgi:hypothetical protein